MRGDRLEAQGSVWDTCGMASGTRPNAHVWSSSGRAGLFLTGLLLPLQGPSLDPAQDALPPAQPPRRVRQPP